MAIGGLDRAGRLEQLRNFARVQVWSGYGSAAEVRAEVFDAVRAEVSDGAQAQRLTEEYIAEADRSLVAAATSWPDQTDVDRLDAALAELEASDLVVLRAVDDHWAANEALQRRTETTGKPPLGVAYFTVTDVWHAVENAMLELNVWHGSSANVAPGDPLLDMVLNVLHRHGFAAEFDEGRIEVSVLWQRRPS
ncbi:MAG: DUF6891 domain-containing protein [Nocardioidaceae bacterium]